MAGIGNVVDGVIQSDKAGNKYTKAVKEATDKAKLGKDAFLQLLVAQMKYQDPMEPTNNTEFVTQYAQFSQVEALQNMQNNMEFTRAQSLVGKVVTLNVTDSKGESNYVTGKVDFVTFEGSKVYLNVNGEKYNLEDLEDVVDPTYLEAYDIATQITDILKKLPPVGSLTLAYESTIADLKSVVEDMNEYQLSFLSDDTVKKLQEYFAKMHELKLAEEQKKENTV